MGAAAVTGSGLGDVATGAIGVVVVLVAVLAAIVAVLLQLGSDLIHFAAHVVDAIVVMAYHYWAHVCGSCGAKYG